MKNSDAKRGKSGGYRCIYLVRDAGDVVLITIYSKSDQGDVSAKTIAEIIKSHSESKPKDK